MTFSKLSGICLAAALSLGTAVAQDTVKGDTKAAGRDTKNAGIETGHATKKVAKKTAHGTKKVAKTTGHDTKVVAEKTGDVAKDVGHDTKVGAEKTGHGIRKAADKVTGKPTPPQL